MTKLPVALYESFQPRFSPELSLRNRIIMLWVWVLMGSGAFSPQKGPKTFGPALICKRQDREKEVRTEQQWLTQGPPLHCTWGFLEAFV